MWVKSRARAKTITIAIGLGTLLMPSPAPGAEKVTFLTSWFAQAEHGGFYQAKATGLYEKAGLDASIKMGGPQINGMQLLLAGETDLMMGYDLAVLKAIEQGLPVMTVGTSFQFDLQGIMAHDNVRSLADLKDKTILVSTPRAGGRGSRPNTSTPTSRRGPIRSICNRSSPIRTRCSSPIRPRSRSRPGRKTCR